MAELRPNHAKEKLARGEVVTCLAGVDTPHLVDFIGHLGVDAVWFEAEHGPVDFEAIGNLSRAADLWGLTPLVRVGSANYSTIYRTLDMGAMGIVVPARRYGRRGKGRCGRGQSTHRSGGVECLVLGSRSAYPTI